MKLYVKRKRDGVVNVALVEQNGKELRFSGSIDVLGEELVGKAVEALSAERNVQAEARAEAQGSAGIRRVT